MTIPYKLQGIKKIILSNLFVHNDIIHSCINYEQGVADIFKELSLKQEYESNSNHCYLSKNCQYY